ncbi:MAG: pantoate--beta-alanine ligase [Sphingobacteriia bacterium]|nr:pantoate--beta-alanine ligase [Sphingobacteriia bacterium]
MVILKTIAEVRERLYPLKKSGARMGWVPTMGALHEGHLSLLQTCKADNEISIASIFVNPTQFGPGEDFEKYPRQLENDKALLSNLSIDYLFCPNVGEIYPQENRYSIIPNKIETIWEGAIRPGHFQGVCLVIAKFLNILQPDKLYLGQKDLQQTIVIKGLLESLNYPVSLIVCPTKRETDGLALSSRNIYLNPEQRQQAPKIFAWLSYLKEQILNNQNIPTALEKIRIEIQNQEGMELEYLELVDGVGMNPISILNSNQLCYLIIAVKLGKTRLIDNLSVF